MEILGYFASLLIGVSLALIGGGGSILTVPVLVYLFGLSPLTATSYSLFVVGSTSLVGAFRNFRKGLVHVRATLLFGASSIVTVFFTRRFLIPALPQQLFRIGNLVVTQPLLTMLLFAVLMVFASLGMIQSKNEEGATSECPACFRFSRLLGYGVGIGFVTGLLGAGGGFLLIPALVLVLRLPMKKAVGTSLSIIAANSLIGFAGDLGHVPINWILLLKIGSLAIAGIFLGSALSQRLPGEGLRKSFGWFVLLMGVYILLRETVL